MAKFLPCRRYHKSPDGKFSHISVVLCRFPYLFKMMQSLSWNIQSFQMGAEKTFSFPWSLPKWEHRSPAFTFFSTLFWLNFFSCGLFLLVPRIASVEFSSAALAHPPGLEPALLQPVAEEVLGAQAVAMGLRIGGRVQGSRKIMSAQHGADSLVYPLSSWRGQWIHLLFFIFFLLCYLTVLSPPQKIFRFLPVTRIVFLLFSKKPYSLPSLVSIETCFLVLWIPCFSAFLQVLVLWDEKCLAMEDLLATWRILITVEWARKAYGLIRHALSKKKKAKHETRWLQVGST